MRPALVLVAHGSRDPDWRGPLDAIAARTGALRPDLDVRLGFLELAPPAPDEAVAAALREGATRIVLAPLFLGQGAHARQDMAALAARLAARHPGVPLELLPSIGEFDSVLEAIATALGGAVPR
jgi:sirohydrochlorin cobaltochelatase